MTTSVDYLLVCEENVEVHQVVSELLLESMQDLGQPPDDIEAAQGAVGIRFRRERADSSIIVGISVEFGDELLASAIREMTAALTSAADRGIQHVVKLSDPEMHEQQQRYAQELFEIEMRLREILSIIFIDTFPDADFYSLLEEVEISVATKDPPQPDYLRAHAENEFFFLLFSSYIRLNTRQLPTKVGELIRLIEESSDFAELKSRLDPSAIVDETYADFLAALVPLMNPIENLRNCVAHNRSISSTLAGDYGMARDQLIARMDDFLARLAPADEAPADEAPADEAPADEFGDS